MSAQTRAALAQSMVDVYNEAIAAAVDITCESLPAQEPRAMNSESLRRAVKSMRRSRRGKRMAGEVFLLALEKIAAQWEWDCASDAGQVPTLQDPAAWRVFPIDPPQSDDTTQ